MKRIIFLSFMALPLMPLAQLKYPPTEKKEVVDDYHGTAVADPYRWLEDDNSADTKEWVKAQNSVTADYLSGIPYRDAIRQRLKDLWNYPKYSSPFKKGDTYYFFMNEGLQNQAVMYRQQGIDGKPEEFLNPNTLNKEGIAALGNISFSKSGKYMAYSIAVAGSDWQEVYVMDAATKQLLKDRVSYVKFSGYSWNGEDGFYYSGYDKPDEKSKLSKQNEFHKVFYHKLGTPQSEDKLIYEDKKHPLRYHGAGLTEDGRFLILSVSQGTSGNEVWYRDMKDAAQKNFKLLVKGFDIESDVVDNAGDKLIVKTNAGAPNYKVVLIDPKKPAPSAWKVLIPETEEALQSVGTAGGQLFAEYLKDASTMVVQYSYAGAKVRGITLPGIGTATGFGGEKTDKEFFYTYTSFTTAPAIYRYDISTGESVLFRRTKINMNTDDFITEQLFFTSKDGTKVPMFLTYKKGMQRNGQNPVLIYGYGGFNVPITPGFSISNAFFIEQGGIYVVVNLRGGSEYGEKWHKAGMLEKKQNVFDDFIGAAEFLIQKKYTNSNKIAIRGGSNGGLLVGAAMAQRPNLFKVALPAVGVLDMLRFHKFTVGWGWSVEYGNADSAKQFPYLYAYSPYHNLVEGKRYPATLITTADHDDRVVPAHSFKFAARLQEYHSGPNPVLIRIDTDAGHGAGKPTNKLIDEAADIWSFVMYNLDMDFGGISAGKSKEQEEKSGSVKGEKSEVSPEKSKAQEAEKTKTPEQQDARKKPRPAGK